MTAQTLITVEPFRLRSQRNQSRDEKFQTVTKYKKQMEAKRTEAKKERKRKRVERREKSEERRERKKRVSEKAEHWLSAVVLKNETNTKRFFFQLTSKASMFTYELLTLIYTPTPVNKK